MNGIMRLFELFLLLFLYEPIHLFRSPIVKLTLRYDNLILVMDFRNLNLLLNFLQYFFIATKLTTPFYNILVSDMLICLFLYIYFFTFELIYWEPCVYCCHMFINIPLLIICDTASKIMKYLAYFILLLELFRNLYIFV